MKKYLKFFNYSLLSMSSIVAVGTTNYVIYSVGLANDFSKANGINNISNYYGDDSSLISFDSYYPAYTDAYTPLVYNTEGFLGLNKDKNKLIFTSYSGEIIWVNDLVNNAQLKAYYSSILSVGSLESYSVKSWIKPLGIEYAAILFSDSSYNKATIMLIDLTTGKITTSSSNSSVSLITKISDGQNTLFTTNRKTFFALKADNNLISQSLQKVDKIALDGALDSFTNISLQSTINLSTIVENGNAYFLGIVTGNLNKGLNFAFFYLPETNKVIGVFLDTNFKLINNSKIFTVVDNITYDLTKLNQQPKNFVYLGDRGSIVNNDTDYFYIGLPIYGNHIVDQNEYNSGFAFIKLNYLSPQQTSQTLYLNYDIQDVNTIETSGNLMYYTKNVNQQTNDVNATTNYGGIVAYNTLGDTIKISDINLPNNLTNNATNISLIPMYGYNKNNDIGYSIIFPKSSDNSENAKHYIGTWNKSIDNSSVINSVNDFVFHTRNDIDKEASLNNTIKYKLPSQITKSDLISLFKFKNAFSNDYVNPNSQYTIDATVGTPNDNNGTLTYVYEITWTAPFDTNKTVTYKASGTINNLYKLSNINFKFVTDASIDSNKYNQIVELKKIKYPSEITKEEIKNYFIQYSIIDNQGNQLNIIDDYITLTPTDNEGNLKVDINLPTDKLPTGVGNNNLNYSHTFNGFINKSQWSYTVIENTSETLKSMYPSLVSKTDLINNIVTLGTGYSKDINDWQIEYTTDDINGSFTVNKFIYIKNDANIPQVDKYKNLITSPKTYSGLKNTIDLFVETPSISNINDKQNILKPSELWNQYKTAVDSNNVETIKNTLIYKSINASNLLVNPLDLVLNITNLDTADKDNKLEYVATIKTDATLVYKVGDTNVRFTNEYETKLKELKPTVYPFKLSQTVYTKVEASLSVNIADKPNVTIDADKKIATIDLSSNSLGNIDNTILADELVNGINDKYKESLLSIFNIYLYTPSIKVDDFDSIKGIVNLTITFNRDTTANVGELTIVYKITINGLFLKPYVEIDNDYINKLTSLTYDANNKLFNVDLSKGDLGDINSSIQSDDFEHNLNNKYISSINRLFKYNKYNSSINIIANMPYDGCINLKIVFTLNQDITKPGFDRTISFSMNISNFKRKPYLKLNLNTINQNLNVTYSSSNNIKIDLKQANFYDINNQILMDDFVNNYQNYQNTILKLFDYSSEYIPTISVKNSNNTTKSVSLSVRFDLNNTSRLNDLQTVEYTIEINNFKYKTNIYINENEVNQNNNVKYDQESQSVVVDISNKSFHNITNEIDGDNFVENFDKYAKEIVGLVECSDDYQLGTVTPIFDKENNSVTIEIVYELKTTNLLSLKANTKPDKVVVTVTILGFKELLANRTFQIVALVLLSLILLIILITLSITIKKAKESHIAKPNKYKFVKKN